ncbi:lipopolysaccharide biosynthesis protein [Photobacterium leiognathi]|uniref:lipopolysaccharide biosynthesis protein n=1 Tax=Photobacterium leiognathi TaxID=553611 RepID=UPI0029812900|nr:oligosaccharide flippase family protein [Photobacterium leiognathi]
MNKILQFAVGPIGGALLGVISLPLLAWYFPSEDIGRISMLQVVTSFSVLLFSFGLDQSYVREYHESDNKTLLLKMAMGPGLFLVILLGFVVFLINPEILSHYVFSIESIKFSLIIFIVILSNIISRFLSLILRMEERGIAFSLGQLLPKLIFVLIVIFYVLFKIPNDFYFLLLANAISAVVVSFVLCINTYKSWINAIYQRINLEKFKEMFFFGFPLIFGGLASWILMATDKIAIKELSSLSELGVYSIALSLGSVGALLSGIFNTLWYPTVYKWHNEGKDLELVNDISEYVQISVIVVFFLVGCFSWITPYLLPHKYQDVKYILPLVIATPLFYTLSETTSIGIGLTKKSVYSMWASLLAALCNVLGNIVLVPMYGAKGAAISTALSMWLFFAIKTEFSSFLWKRVGGIKAYIATTIPLIGSFIYVGWRDDKINIAIWLLILLLSFLIYRKTINKLYRILVSYIKKHTLYKS